MKSLYFAAFCAAFSLTLAGVAGTGIAQERTAGGALDTQMTWTALSNVAKAASDKADMVSSRVDQVVVCGRKGMVYAPGLSGADGQGCAWPTHLNNIIECGRQNKIFSSATNSCVVPNELTGMITCGNQKKVYSAATNSCMDVDSGTRWTRHRAGPTTGGNQMSNSSEMYRALQNIGMPECGSDMGIARKCSPQGKECAVISSSQRSCGSQGDYECHTYSADIYRCD
jgi:hypothetical protein